jgi:hypothetical protein
VHGALGRPRTRILIAVGFIAVGGLLIATHKNNVWSAQQTAAFLKAHTTARRVTCSASRKPDWNYACRLTFATHSEVTSVKVNAHGIVNRQRG